MIGKIIGAVAGSKIAEHTRGLSGPFGAVAGVFTATALRRFSVPALIALAAGGYFAKKALDSKQNDAPGKPTARKPKAAPA